MKKLSMLSAVLLSVVSVAAMFLTSCSEPEIPQGYAIVYGIEDYYGTGSDLNYTRDDAEAMTELLEDKGWIVTPRYDEEATPDQLVTDIEILSSQIGSTDRFLFYFSGHGFSGDIDGSAVEGYYASTSDADEYLIFYDSAALVAVSDDVLASIFDEVPTENKTIIADACFSGGLIGDGFTVSSIDADYVMNSSESGFMPYETLKLYAGWAATDNDFQQSQYAILTAAGEDEESLEPLPPSSIAHGYFTYFLLETPSTADFNSDGYITLTEAWYYISAALDYYINSDFTTPDEIEYQYMTNIAAFPVDPVLFEAD